MRVISAGAHCVVTAINVSSIKKTTRPSIRSAMIVTTLAFRYVRKVVFGGDIPPGGGTDLEDWNDAPERTQAEVVAALLAAAELADAEEAGT
jgi:hypothetical protein